MVIATNELPQIHSDSGISPVSMQFDAACIREVGENPAKWIDSLLDECRVQPRPYQRRIVSSALQMFAGTYKPRNAATSPASNSVLIESPTGSGKTVMGLATAAIMQRLTGASVGWVSMRRNLLAQAEVENQLRGFGVKFHPISMFEKQPPQVDLLIVDEAQHDAATSMANLHSQIRPTWTLGLSATPYRSDRIKLCFDSVIRDAGIASLIADGYLSPYHHYTIPEYTPQAIAALLTEDLNRWGKSLVFFHKREQCDLLKLLLLQAGITCDVVTATSQREKQLDAFVSGKIQVLINMAILTEGFDCPELKTVFCRPSGKGCTIQMAGRVLRRSSHHSFKQIVQCRQTPHPMLKTAMAAEQYLWTDHGWRSIHANTALNEMTLAARHRVANSTAQLPKLVAMHRTRRASWWGQSES